MHRIASPTPDASLADVAAFPPLVFAAIVATLCCLAGCRTYEVPAPDANADVIRNIECAQENRRIREFDFYVETSIARIRINDLKGARLAFEKVRWLARTDAEQVRVRRVARLIKAAGAFPRCLELAVASLKTGDLSGTRETLTRAMYLAKGDREREKVVSLKRLIVGAELFAEGRCREARELWRAIPSPTLAREVQREADRRMRFAVSNPVVE